MALEIPLIRTEVVLPRNYCLAFSSFGRRHYLSPSAYALGQVIRLTERQLDEYLKEWLAVKKEESVHPTYRKKDLTGFSFDDLKELLLERIEGVEGARNLYRVGGSEAVHSIIEYPSALVGQVKRITHGGEKGKDVAVSLANPWLTLDGLLNYGDATSESTGAYWEDAKRIMYHDPYVCALEIENHHKCKNSQSRIERKQSVWRKVPSMPFRLAEENDPEIRKLLVDVLIGHYVQGKGYYRLNRELLDNPRVYQPAALEMILQGKAQFKVVRQINQERKIPKYRVDIARKVIRAAEHRLMKEGFRREGLVLEFKDSPYEVIGERYQNKEREVTIAVEPCSHLPYFVSRILKQEKADIFARRRIMDRHPLVRAEKDRNRPTKGYLSLDDATRRAGNTKIFLPGMTKHLLISIPPWLEREAGKIYCHLTKPSIP